MKFARRFLGLSLLAAGFLVAGNVRADILINELDCDQAGTPDVGEFIELYNPDGAPVDLGTGGYVLVFYNGSTAAPLDGSYRVVTMAGIIAAGGYYVVGNTGVAGVNETWPSDILQQGQDGVALFKGVVGTPWAASQAATFVPGGATRIDALCYDTDDADDLALIAALTPGQPQINEDENPFFSTLNSIQRLGDGAGGAFITSSMGLNAPTPNATNFGVGVPVEVSKFTID